MTKHKTVGYHHQLGPNMQTFSGKPYYPLNPRICDVRIDDIAHHLSMICRFSGAVKFHYSVGQHSLLVSDIAQQMAAPGEKLLMAYIGLMHDATEAYLNDVIKPIKDDLKGYNEIEKRNWEVIDARFKLPSEGLPDVVKRADILALVIERHYVLNPSDGTDWGDTPELDVNVKPIIEQPQSAVKMAFKQRHDDLYEAVILRR